MMWNILELWATHPPGRAGLVVDSVRGVEKAKKVEALSTPVESDLTGLTLRLTLVSEEIVVFSLRESSW